MLEKCQMKLKCIESDGSDFSEWKVNEAKRFRFLINRCSNYTTNATPVECVYVCFSSLIFLFVYRCHKKDSKYF
jgi:hypothetical protein